ncbi:MAG: MBL fold metallo-hydrolase [Cohnella sp.]|nr:MBL fold metallo-hydrolase [Cohnella sp.]
MMIQKLPWAGIRAQVGDTSIAIDPLYHFPPEFNQPHEPLIPLDEFGPVDAVLITHHHYDHFDPEAIAKYYGEDTPVYMPAESLPLAGNHALTRLRGVAFGETVEIGPVSATTSYAVDGVGDPQVSWVVRGDGKRLLHSGDTLWHGYWWKIKEAFGPFDAVCLPVNAAVVELPGMTPSGQPITMSPEQAVSAAVVLEAKALVPIHYKAVHHPPLYSRTSDVEERLRSHARQRQANLVMLDTGEVYEVAGGVGNGGDIGRDRVF